MEKVEKLANKIFIEFEKDGEPVSWEEACEMAEMEIKAKGVKNYVRAEPPKAEKDKVKKKQTVKVSDEKQQLFNDILTFLNTKYENVTVSKQNKLILIEIGGKNFKLDLIQSRK